VTRDDQARAIIAEFANARRIAVGTFMRRWAHQAPWFGSAEAHNLVIERLVVFAGLMPTTNITGRDSDAGKLDDWREVAATKPDPKHSLESLIIHKLVDDLHNAAFRVREWGLPSRGVSLDYLRDEFDYDAPAITAQEWEAHWAERYPVVTALFRDGKFIRELKQEMNSGSDTIRAMRDKELAEIRKELVEA
jgi:hypothetical protein